MRRRRRGRNCHRLIYAGGGAGVWVSGPGPRARGASTPARPREAHCLPTPAPCNLPKYLVVPFALRGEDDIIRDDHMDTERTMRDAEKLSLVRMHVTCRH